MPQPHLADAVRHAERVFLSSNFKHGSSLRCAAVNRSAENLPNSERVSWSAFVQPGMQARMA